MSFSHSSRSKKYPLERLFHPEMLAKPQGLELHIPKSSHPQVAGIAFEILMNLRLSHSHAHKKSIVKNLRSHFSRYTYYNPELSKKSESYLNTGEASDVLLKNIWIAAKRQQDIKAWGIPEDRKPKKAEIDELRVLHTWISELDLKISDIILTGGNYLSEPDLLVRSRSKNIVYEFKLVSSLDKFRENLTQGLLYLFDYSCSGGNPIFDELWIFYPRHKFIQKVNIKKALLPEAGSYADVYHVLRRHYKKKK